MRSSILLLSLAACACASGQSQVGPVQAVSISETEREYRAISVEGFPPGAEGARLYRNAASSTAAAINRMPKGYVEPRHYHSTAGHSLFVVKGRLSHDGKILEEGHFEYYPAATAHGPFEALEDTEFLIFADGSFDVQLGDPPDRD